MEHSYNKPEIPGQTVCYKQEFVISEQFNMRYCSTWLRSLLCYIKKFVIEEFVIRVFHCISARTHTHTLTTDSGHLLLLQPLGERPDCIPVGVLLGEVPYHQSRSVDPIRLEGGRQAEFICLGSRNAVVTNQRVGEDQYL